MIKKVASASPSSAQRNLDWLNHKWHCLDTLNLYIFGSDISAGSTVHFTEEVNSWNRKMAQGMSLG